MAASNPPPVSRRGSLASLAASPELFIGPDFTEPEVSAIEREVVPRYLAHFIEVGLPRLIVSPEAAVGIVGPLAAWGSRGVLERLPGARLALFDCSQAALAKSGELIAAPHQSELVGAQGLPAPSAGFSHLIVTHPLVDVASRARLIAECRRVLVPAGQLIFALPLRGSYPEVLDMLREFALKQESPQVAEAVELAAASRPNPETLTEELEAAGFVDVTVDVELLDVPFSNGREFVADPLFSVWLRRDLERHGGVEPALIEAAVTYVHNALARYFGELPFELGVNVGCALARAPNT